MAESDGLWTDFSDRFRIGTDPTMLRIEQRVLGSDYGASSYTDMDQARQLADCLRLEAGSMLLDIGSGAGWPGNFLANETGCTSVLTDPTFEGMTAADSRARGDGLSGARVVAKGFELPFREQSFDASTASDVY